MTKTKKTAKKTTTWGRKRPRSLPTPQPPSSLGPEVQTCLGQLGNEALAAAMNAPEIPPAKPALTGNPPADIPILSLGADGQTSRCVRP